MAGLLYDEGTHFEVTESEYLNVTVDSTEPVRLMIKSVPNTVNIHLAPVTSALWTTLTVGNLVPGATYYVYVDDLDNGTGAVADATGFISFDVDLSAEHMVHILTNQSTLFISDDATGGDCASIGIWDASTKTCTLTTDLGETIQIKSGGITLDGNGHTITGSTGYYSGYGVYVNGGGYYGDINGITIKNLNITGFSVGIFFTNYVRHSAIKDNNLYGNRNGAYLDYYSRINEISGNTFTDNSSGMSCYYGTNNLDISNNYFGSNWQGLYSTWAHYIYFRDNTVESNTIGLWISGNCGSEFERNTITNSSVYGIRYSNPYWCGSRWFRANTISYNNFGFYMHAPHTDVYLNNFVDNGTQIYVNSDFGSLTHPNSNNTMSVAPPMGGNYWSDYDTAAEGCEDTNADGFCDAPLVLSSREQDNYPHTSPVTNSPPKANGADQTVECTGPEGASVTLDGSGSYDPDGDPITYTWTGAFGTVEGVSPTVTLPYHYSNLVILTVTDSSGYTDTDRVYIRVQDTTPPTSTATLFGEEGNNDWFKSEVDVRIDAVDSCTGVKSIHYILDSEPQVVSTANPTWVPTITDDGEHTLTYWSEDNAGNYQQVTVPVKKETVPPITTPTVPAPPPDTGGSYKGCVNVTLQTSSVSGEEVIKYSLDGGITWEVYTGQVTICNEGTTTVQYRSTSTAGNVEPAKTIEIKIDTTPPLTTHSLSGTMGNNNWYVSDVAVTLTATDATSGVAEIHYVLDGVEQVVTANAATFTVSPDGPHTVTYWAKDVAGNAEAQQGPVSFKIDQTLPVITITGVTEGAKYPACSPPSPGYTVTDTASGVPEGSHSATTEGGNANGVGTFTYTVTATDNAGNTVTAAVTYKVVYSFDGFQTPVTLSRPFKLGSTIPVKFVLTDGCGAYVPNATAALSLVQLSGAEPLGDPIDGTSNVPDSGNVFRYVLTDNHYIYNLSTGDSLSTGIWRVTVTLDDGETYSVDIGIK